MRVRSDESAREGHTVCWMPAPGQLVLTDSDGHATAMTQLQPEVTGYLDGQACE
jgi:hypothetical protein